MAGALAPGTDGIAAPGGIIEPPPGIDGAPAPGADGIAAPGGIIEPPPGIDGAAEPGIDGAAEPGIDGIDGADAPGIDGIEGVLCASNPAGARLIADAANATIMIFMERS